MTTSLSVLTKGNAFRNQVERSIGLPTRDSKWVLLESGQMRKGPVLPSLAHWAIYRPNESDLSQSLKSRI